MISLFFVKPSIKYERLFSKKFTNYVQKFYTDCLKNAHCKKKPGSHGNPELR